MSWLELPQIDKKSLTPPAQPALLSNRGAPFHCTASPITRLVRPAVPDVPAVVAPAPDDPPVAVVAGAPAALASQCPSPPSPQEDEQSSGLRPAQPQIQMAMTQKLRITTLTPGKARTEVTNPRGTSSTFLAPLLPPLAGCDDANIRAAFRVTDLEVRRRSAAAPTCPVTLALLNGIPMCTPRLL